MALSKMATFTPIEVVPILPSMTGLGDEYDPLRPNEYEEFSKRRKKQRREDERKLELEEREKYDHIFLVLILHTCLLSRCICKW